MIDDILIMNWEEIEELPLEKALEIQSISRDAILSYQSKCDSTDLSVADYRALKLRVSSIQNLLTKVNRHIKQARRHDHACRKSLMARLKEQKEARGFMNTEISKLKSERSGMICEIKALKLKIENLEKQNVFSLKFRK